MLSKFPLTISCALLLGSLGAEAQLLVIDNFEVDEGHFNLSPSFSGTTTGETETGPGAGPSTADRVEGEGLDSFASQRIFLDDSPAADVPSTDPVQAWRARLLSGGGTPANNVTLQATAEGYVGYFLKTTTPNLQASIMIDDGTGLERATYLNIIPDGAWHLYEWKFSDVDAWEPFAGTGANGEINATGVTIDSIFISAIKDLSIADQDATFYIDNVSTNPLGSVIPEPSSVVLAGFAAAGVLGLRRRR